MSHNQERGVLQAARVDCLKTSSQQSPREAHGKTGDRLDCVEERVGPSLFRIWLQCRTKPRQIHGRKGNEFFQQLRSNQHQPPSA